MNRPQHPRTWIVCLLAVMTFLIGGLAQGRAGEVALDGKTFKLPDGFTIEKVAGPPMVDRPVVADFDELGRLYVADSSGSNEKVEKQLAEKPHRIVRLEDTDGDGKFDKSIVFADKMMFPSGAMWLDGSLYVSAPPSIWKLTDTNGDGVADERVEWIKGKTLTGCANDLHGPYAGPDGWIYWTKGAFAQQSYERPGKKPFVTRAAHIFRARPDGSGLEPVMTGGMDNPVDVVFTPGGERIFTTTFLQSPSGGLRDGIIHAIYGGLYGKVNDALDGHPRTGPDLMPVLVHLGPAAPCGLTAYESEAFGKEYRGNLFACNFNLRKVTRHVLTPKGATFESRNEDFLVSTHQDFHPTDVIEDADGSLLVVDTGGWYKLCCPTSQIEKPDVLGAIYRVRKVGAKKQEDPRGLLIKWDSSAPRELAPLLGDPRPAVRRRAIATLAARGTKSLAELAAVIEKGSSPEARRNAVWSATRIDGEEARRVDRVALKDSDESVRQVAIHSASVREDRKALAELIGLLSGQSIQNQRAAAEALGRLGDSAAVPALLAATSDVQDRILEHSLTYALIEIADPRATEKSLSDPSAKTRRAALIALDQMEGGGLKPLQLAPALGTADPANREIASWIVGRRPEWAGELAGFLKNRLLSMDLDKSDGETLTVQLAQFAGAEPVQRLIADALADSRASRQARLVSLRAISRSHLKAAPKGWVEGLAVVLKGEDRELASEAVGAAKALTLEPEEGRALAEALLSIGDDNKLPASARLDALGAVPIGVATISPKLFAFLRSELDPEKPVAARTAAAGVLAKSSLGSDQLLELTAAVKAAGPLEIDRLLTAYEASSDEKVGLKLIESLKTSSALGSLRADMIKPRIEKYSESVKKAAEALYAMVNVDAASQKAKLEEMLPKLAGGDERRGQAVFNGAKAGCLSCHAVGYVGGQVGPDMTRIGEIRTERDLLESILFPSLSFVRSYEPVTVATKAGKVVNGLLKQETSDEVVLTVNATEHAHIKRDEIEEMRPGTVSVMPAGLDQQLTLPELADLLAFLKSRK